jgi:hypothetical protein
MLRPIATLLAALSLTRPALADDAAPPSVGPPRAAPGCVLRGEQPVAKGTALYDAPTGGRVIARFTGARAPLTLASLPADPTSGERAAVRTSSASGAVRLEGYVDPSAVSVFTTRDLVVEPGHLWITGSQKVRVLHAASNELRVERTLLGTDQQTVTTTAPCDAFALAPPPPVGRDAPARARGHSTRGQSLALLDKPGGKPFFSMRLVEGTAQVFWTTELRGGYAHIESRFDVAIDGWAAVKDLEPIRPAEVMVRSTPPVVSMVGAQIALPEPPPVRRVVRESPLFSAREGERAIGVVEPGAEIYVVSESNGWGEILPASLYVEAPETDGFWVKLDALGSAP